MKKILTLITLAIAINATLPSCSDGDSNTSAITPSSITKSDKIRIDIPFTKVSDTLINFTTSSYEVWNQFPELSPYKSVRDKITDFVVDSITVQVSGISGDVTTAIYGWVTVSSDVGNTYFIGWNTNMFNASGTNPYLLSAPFISDLSTQMSLYDLGKKLSSKPASLFEIAIGPDANLSNYSGVLDCRSTEDTQLDINCVKSFYSYFAKDMLKINKATFGSSLQVGKSTLSSGTLSIRVYYHGKFPVGV